MQHSVRSTAWSAVRVLKKWRCPAGFTRSSSDLIKVNRVYWVLLGFAGFYWIALSITGLYWDELLIFMLGCGTAFNSWRGVHLRLVRFTRRDHFFNRVRRDRCRDAAGISLGNPSGARVGHRDLSFTSRCAFFRPISTAKCSRHPLIHENSKISWESHSFLVSGLSSKGESRHKKVHVFFLFLFHSIKLMVSTLGFTRSDFTKLDLRIKDVTKIPSISRFIQNGFYGGFFIEFNPIGFPLIFK